MQYDVRELGAVDGGARCRRAERVTRRDRRKKQDLFSSKPRLTRLLVGEAELPTFSTSTGSWHQRQLKTPPRTAVNAHPAPSDFAFLRVSLLFTRPFAPQNPQSVVVVVAAVALAHTPYLVPPPHPSFSFFPPALPSLTLLRSPHDRKLIRTMSLKSKFKDRWSPLTASSVSSSSDGDPKPTVSHSRTVNPTFDPFLPFEPPPLSFPPAADCAQSSPPPMRPRGPSKSLLSSASRTNPAPSDPAPPQPIQTLITSAHALLLHRARRLAIVQLHGTPEAVVFAYQELVMDTHSFVAVVESVVEVDTDDASRSVSRPRSAIDLSASGTRLVRSDSVRSLGRGARRASVRQLALVQALDALRERLTALAPVVRRLSAGETQREGVDPEMQTLLEAFVETAASCLEISLKHVAPAEPGEEDAPRAAARQTSVIDLRRRAAAQRSFSDLVTEKEKARATARLSDPVLPTPTPTSKRTASSASPKSPPPTPDTTVFPTLLKTLITAITINQNELDLLERSLPPSSPTTPKLSADLALLNRCYSDATSKIVPAARTLANLWSSAFVGSVETIRELRAEAERHVAEVEELRRRCADLEALNGVLLEENMRLGGRGGADADADALPARPPPRPPRSLPTPPAAAQPPQPDTPPRPPTSYRDIVDDGPSSRSDSVAVSRMQTEISSVEALLDMVEKKRGARTAKVVPVTATPTVTITAKATTTTVGGIIARGGIDLARNAGVPMTSLTLPGIRGCPPLWASFLSPTPEHLAAIKIQAQYRAYAARKSFRTIQHRYHIAQEMLATEASYLRGLLTIHKEFMIPLKRDPDVLPRKDFATLFRYVEDVMALGERVLAALAGVVCAWHVEAKVGECTSITLGSEFASFSAGDGLLGSVGLTRYVHVYVCLLALSDMTVPPLLLLETSYSIAMETLTRASQLPAFKPALAMITKTLGRGAPELTDLLITPVQRPPRYLLLLKELLKRTPPSHPDHADLRLAISKMERAVTRINELERGVDGLRKIEDVLVGCPVLTSPLQPLTTPHTRKLQTRGPLHELTSAGPVDALKRPIHVFLFSDILVAADPRRDGSFGFRWAVAVADWVAIAPGGDDLTDIDAWRSGASDLSLRVSWKAAGGVDMKIVYAPTSQEHQKWLQVPT
ncbi:hypothetical protein BDK51DRAFT_50346 [Blyttiomyces helicus]|uniref:DH domain-containing protein n=1 Tax=Blyttiomyces helicus TaxID=388810 RepID=A0A4P9WCA3_9FUNG|nr:hypothetical protein BDK51DRAFT_50346 [Blyttiomyces helicus]|eukprot:RKO90279.1 hypothetical protein BDK51DRAFT_50346 [Blyttiomyces helicus]